MAFSIPSLPTDNLYKFYSLSGLVVLLFSLIFLVIQYDDLINSIDTLKKDVDLLELESDFLSDDIESLNEKEAYLRSSLAEYDISRDFSKSKYEHFSEFIKNLQNDEQYRDYIEFTFKYEEFIIPG
ncbi:MAG: hypothetical protein AAF688_06420, partial [Bacteroidota bacterium]